MRGETYEQKIKREDTGYIKVHNCTGQGNMYPYITIIYRQYEEGKFGWKEVDGPPIYFHQMTTEQLALAMIIGNAQAALHNSLQNNVKK